MSIITKIKKSALYKQFTNLLDKIVIPGFDGLSLLEVGTFFIEGTKKGYLNTRAYSLAFQFFLALFPLIIFLFTLIPFVPIAGFQDELMLVLGSILPSTAFDMAQETIMDIVNKPRGGLLSVGFVLALYFSTNGVNAMINAFNKSYHVTATGNFLQQRLNAVVVLFIMVLLVIAGITGLVYGNIFIDNLHAKNGHLANWILWTLNTIKIVFVLVLYFLGISFIYYFGSIKKNRWKFISAGSTLATVLSLALTYIFGYYVNNFGTYNKVYGSIGALLVIMLWLYLNSLILLIGYELNASIKKARHAKKHKQ